MRNALQLVLEIFKCYYSVREKQEFTFTKLPNLTASFVQLNFFNVIYKQNFIKVITKTYKKYLN